MQGICTYIPETNNVPREYTVAAILLLLFMVPISLVSALALLCFYVSTFRSMCAVPNMAVFCSFLTLWFPGMLLMYFLNDFEIVPVAPIIAGILLLLLLLLLLFQYCSCCSDTCFPVHFHVLFAVWISDTSLLSYKHESCNSSVHFTSLQS
jgi:hypothetical protein